VGHGLLIQQISRSHTTTPLDEWSAPLRVYLKKHNTHNIHTSMRPGGIRTRNPSKQEATSLCLRPRGHWDQLGEEFHVYNLKKTIVFYRICGHRICGHRFHQYWPTPAPTNKYSTTFGQAEARWVEGQTVKTAPRATEQKRKYRAFHNVLSTITNIYNNNNCSQPQENWKSFFWQLEMFDVCITGYTAQIDTIFRS
jgi:hypothetical protein